jgi:beta-lactamase class C
MKKRIAGVLLLGGIAAFSLIFIQGHSHYLPFGEPVRAASPLITTAPSKSDGGTFPGDTTTFRKTIRRFDDFLRSSLDSMGTVGAAATVFHDNEIAYTLCYGLRRAGTSDSVDRHTVFRLASVSKGFAGILACQLDNQGRIDLDDRVILYLPGFRLKDSVSTNELAIRHLLSHTSGLVPHAYDNLAEEGQKVGEILPRLAEVDIAAPPGRLYGYQNVLFSLIDTIVLLGTGTDYPELMAENIFRPLGMDDASTGFRGLVWNPDVAFPHTRRKREFYPLPLHTGYYNLLPAAGVNASIEDMGKWLKALLGNSPDAIPPEVLRQISNPEVETPLKKAYTRQWDRIDGRYYSFGWRVFDYKGCRIMYHGGYVKGYRAEIAFCPELGTGLAFLENSPNGVASLCVPTFFNLLIEEEQASAASSRTQPDLITP